MLLNRPRTRNPFLQMHEDMNRLFSGLTPGWTFNRPSAAWHRPAHVSEAAMNVWEDDHNYYCELELPGFTTEDIDVQVVGSELTVKGTRKSNIPDNAKVLHQERQTVEFTRAMTLPSDIKTDDVQATMHDGVLTVMLPKTEQATARRIEIKSTQAG